MSVPRFRRAAQFDPTQIAGCQLWLDASDSSSMILSGSTVTQWNDKSGNLKNTTSYVGTPTFNASALNGKQAITLNGSSSLTGSLTGSGTTTTVCIVGTQGPTCVQNGGILCFGRPGYTDWTDPGSFPITEAQLTGAMCVTRGSVNTYKSYTGFDTPFMYILSFDGTYGNTYTNAVIQPSSNSSGTFAYTNYVVGNRAGNTGNFFWTGLISEAHVYNTALNDSQRLQVEGYLTQKWGLKSYLPAGHPGMITTIYPTQRIARILPVSYSTAFSPLSISGCQIWLDAADTTKYTLSGSNVTQIVDKSSNAYTFTGSVGTYPTQTTTLNGLPVISSAAGQFVQNTSFNQNFTSASCFVVIRPTEDITPNGKYSNGYPLYAFIAGSASGAFQFNINYANQTQNPGDDSRFTVSINRSGTGLLYGALGGSSVSTYNPVNTTLLMSGVLSGSSSTNSMFLNGSAINLNLNSSGSLPLISSLTMYCIGLPNGQSFGYQFAEALVYGTTLTASQVQQVESYLAQKWGLTTSLPTSHLNTTQPAGVPSFTQNVFGQVKRSFLNVTPGIVATGGDSIVDANGYRIHTFTTVGSQTFTVTRSPLSGAFQVLVVGGGGGGGGYYNGGGGGAGGVVYTTSFTIPTGTYTVTVGGGGGGASGGNNPGINGTSGTNSSFLTLTGNGGGGGGADNYVNGLSGGCGGGMGPLGASAPGSGTQGFAGGYGTNGANMGNLGGSYGSGYGGGGGGGMGSVGSNALTSGGPGWGGLGQRYTVGGQSYLVAAGGGGGTADTDNTNFGLGGSSIGGNGGLNAVRVATSGAANTGSGGGGYGRVGTGSSGGSGGSGRVIIAYPFVAPSLTAYVTTLTYTGSIRTFAVPAGVTSVRLYMWGAGGGTASAVGGFVNYSGGAGAMVQGVYTVTPGSTLYVVVGKGGVTSQSTQTDAQGGGGGANSAGGGGGRSAIQLTSGGADVVVAGGGGGGGLLYANNNGTGGPAYFSGSSPNTLAAVVCYGGTQTAGGAAGGNGNVPGNPGTLKFGGAGTGPGGGGGGGYYGGGGMGNGDQGWGPGAGGSSLIDNLTLIPGESVFGYNSPNLSGAPNTSSLYYQSNIAAGGIGANATGGNGLVVIVYYI